MPYKDNNDGYPSLIQDTISSIKVPIKREGNLVSKEVKERDKSLAKEFHELQKDGSDFENDEHISCVCDECETVGLEGEVAGHTEECTCYTCHHWYGKLR